MRLEEMTPLPLRVRARELHRILDRLRPGVEERCPCLAVDRRELDQPPRRSTCRSHATIVKSVGLNRESCSCAAATTMDAVADVQAADAAGEVDEGVAATSVSVAPRPSEIDGKEDESGSATTRSLRSRISFERGPGISVRRSIVRVTATRRKIPNVLERPADMQPLRESDLADDPFTQFAAWFGEGGRRGRPRDDDARHRDPRRRPSARMVLLKEHGPDGFVFFTGYGSRKGRELEENPRAALVFYWRELDARCGSKGTLNESAGADSEADFRTRGSSRAVTAPGLHGRARSSPDRRSPEGRGWRMPPRFGEDVPLLDHGGGYRLLQPVIEFWRSTARTACTTGFATGAKETPGGRALSPQVPRAGPKRCLG